MHMADALVSPAVGAVMYGATAITAAVSISKLKKEEKLQLESTSKRLPAMAVMSALVFAGQMINYTIPGTGSSGHLCGGMMLTAVLGPFAGFLSMIVILAIQCLFFADGGLLALGANIWNMAFYGCFVGYFLIYRPIVQGKLFKGKGLHAANRMRITLASILGCILTLQLGSFSVVLQTQLSGIAELPLGGFVALMQPIHLVIGLIEGLITTAVLLFLYQAQPTLLRDVPLTEEAAAEKRFSFKGTIAVLAIVALVIGGGMSLLASSNPDGLEWSMFGNQEAGYSANMGLDEESFGIRSEAADTAASIQEKTAILPDYAFANNTSNPAGTSVSGILGVALVAGVAVLVCGAGGFFRRKRVSNA